MKTAIVPPFSVFRIVCFLLSLNILFRKFRKTLLRALQARKTLGEPRDDWSDYGSLKSISAMRPGCNSKQLQRNIPVIESYLRIYDALSPMIP